MSNKKSRKLEKSSTIFLDVQRLRQRRKEIRPKKVIQDDIAQILGIERSTYVGYEKLPEFEVSPEQAESIAKLLNTTVKQIESQNKVDINQQNGNFRDEIFEGDYIGLHKRVWDQMEANMILHREVIRDLIKKLPQASNS